MAINIQHTYSTHVTMTFYSKENFSLRCDDVGTMDELAERMCEILVKHDFVYADASDRNTGEVVLIVERT